MGEVKKWQIYLCLAAAIIFGFFLGKSGERKLKIDSADELRSAFAPEITEIEVVSKKADFDHFRDSNRYGQTRQFLRTLLKSEIFVFEIRKRQYQESFNSTVCGWRVPWKREFTSNGKLAYEWGFIFRMEGPDTKMFPTCLVYSSYAGKVADLEYLGNDHGLPTVEEAKNAIVKALKEKGRR